MALEEEPPSFEAEEVFPSDDPPLPSEELLSEEEFPQEPLAFTVAVAELFSVFGSVVSEATVAVLSISVQVSVSTCNTTVTMTVWFFCSL